MVPGVAGFVVANTTVPWGTAVPLKAGVTTAVKFTGWFTTGAAGEDDTVVDVPEAWTITPMLAVVPVGKFESALVKVAVSVEPVGMLGKVYGAQVAVWDPDTIAAAPQTVTPPCVNVTLPLGCTAAPWPPSDAGAQTWAENVTGWLTDGEDGFAAGVTTAAAELEFTVSVICPGLATT
jgi:hypothetical protein